MSLVLRLVQASWWEGRVDLSLVPLLGRATSRDLFSRQLRLRKTSGRQTAVGVVA